MLKFKYSSLIDAPVEKVWEFHERDNILRLLTPPWQPVKIIRHEGGLQLDAISEFCLFFGPINVRWIARHVEYEKYKLFTDQQVEGPMEHWIHRHRFNQEKGQTRLTDEIQYAIPGGLLVESLLSWWVDSRLQEMFRYRHQVTKKQCEEN